MISLVVKIKDLIIDLIKNWKKTCVIRSLLLNLDPYGGNDLDGMCPLFYKQVAHELAPKVTLILGTWLY